MAEPTRICGFVPWPNGAYSHWFCQRAPHHLGSHRFNNYMIVRFPRIWHLKALTREFRLGRKLRRYTKDGCRPARASYRRALYPATYSPVPVTAANLAAAIERESEHG